MPRSTIPLICERCSDPDLHAGHDFSAFVKMLLINHHFLHAAIKRRDETSTQ